MQDLGLPRGLVRADRRVSAGEQRDASRDPGQAASDTIPRGTLVAGQGKLERVHKDEGVLRTAAFCCFGRASLFGKLDCLCSAPQHCSNCLELGEL